MNTKNRYLIILPLIVMTIAALACGLPKLSSQEDFEIAVQQTVDAGGALEIEEAVAPDEGEGESEEIAVRLEVVTKMRALLHPS